MARELPQPNYINGYGHVHFAEIVSTNILAMEYARSGLELGGLNGGLWVTADIQTGGRARRGRSWVSPKGNLYASFLHVGNWEPQKLAVLSLAVSNAVYDVCVLFLASGQADVKIKWPNDVLVNGKKICGILLEAEQTQSGNMALVMGCGVNVAHFPDNPLYPATSFHQEGVKIGVDDVFKGLADALAHALSELNRDDGAAIVSQTWKSRACGVGKPITVRLPHEEKTGFFLDIDRQGMLLLRHDNGEIERIASGDVFFVNGK